MDLFCFSDPLIFSDPSREFITTAGRPIKLSEGKPIASLIPS